jgi:hypothetical protein
MNVCGRNVFRAASRIKFGVFSSNFVICRGKTFPFNSPKIGFPLPFFKSTLAVSTSLSLILPNIPRCQVLLNRFNKFRGIRLLNLKVITTPVLLAPVQVKIMLLEFTIELEGKSEKEVLVSYLKVSELIRFVLEKVVVRSKGDEKRAGSRFEMENTPCCCNREFNEKRGCNLLALDLALHLNPHVPSSRL